MRLASLCPILLSVVPAGCGGSSGDEDTSSNASEPMSGEESELDSDEFTQVIQGADLFLQRCASCHGETAEGTDDGPGILFQGTFDLGDADSGNFEFVTAADLFEWISTMMPADDPGALSSSDYYRITAFLVSSAGIVLEEPLTADNADSLKLEEEPDDSIELEDVPTEEDPPPDE